MNLAGLLVALSGIVAMLLGAAHLYLTYFTRAFYPRDASLEARLKTVSPILTPDTTLWRSQIGFHVSHSMGPLLFGVIYLYFGLWQSTLLFHSPFLMALGGVVLLCYLLLAKLYWFRRPLVGLLLALGFYIAGILVASIRQG